MGTLIGREVLAYTDCDYVGVPARDFAWWPAVARVGGGLRDSGQDSIAALRLSLEQSHGVVLWSTGACLLFHNDCDDCQVGLVNVYIPMVGGANNQDQVRDGAFRYHLWTSNEGAIWYLGACLYLLHMIVTTFRE